jgi:molybdopterin synthase catalytic subunit
VILLTRDPLDPETLTTTVRDGANGGVVTFLGTVRNNTDGRHVLYLEYEAYEDMAEKVLARIIREVTERWNGSVHTSIAHRLGRMEIGDISLIVVVASPHRAEAFAACQHIVDRIKQDVPIWKKEVFKDGEVWVGSEGQHTPSTA